LYEYTTDLLCLDFCRRATLCTSPQLELVATPLVVDAWARALSHHPDRAFARYVCVGLKFGFRIGFMVTQGAGNLASDLYDMISFGSFQLFAMEDLQLFISLVFIAVVCILMGAGIPTTALYIMLVSVAQPALAQLGVPPIASHLFVLYYGVVSEITPPVCTSAYAAAAIANSNPFRTGLSAFTLGLGKVIAPMAFVYAPVLLFVSSTGFNLLEFTYTATSCIAGVIALSAAVVCYWLKPMNIAGRVLMAIAGIIFVAPSLTADMIALVVASPVIVTQLIARSRSQSPA